MSALASMTGFARTAGANHDASWAWELRSVNGRGLDLRFKLPPGLDRLEPQLRALATARLSRGTVQASLAIRGDDQATIVVDRVLLARLAAEARAYADSATGAPAPRIELLMALPGVIRRETAEATPTLADERLDQVKTDFALALEHLVATRQAEGGRLEALLRGLLAQLGTLRALAAGAAADQPRAQQARMTEALSRLLNSSPPVPAERLAQEVALLAARSDVTEEIDRLGSHLAAAEILFDAGGPVGRQLDFLVQEFLREANTLCSKSASAALTGHGLQMKSIIEQIREQVQNIE
jgi:uncharacterized protein (TIGR00255 family)